MIFVTVGTQLPFDRLMAGVDQWAEVSGYREIFAQRGRGEYSPRYMRSEAEITPREFNQYVMASELLIAHAALDYAKPIVLLPRRASLGEHRNDHQLATVQKFAQLPQVFAATTVDELAAAVERALSVTDQVVTGLGSNASAQLLDAVRGFVREAA
jgi:UDP-N-acetylglucosamine transferase subunit ALG13